MFNYNEVKDLIQFLEKIQDDLYSFFYDLKAPKIGCLLGTPFYHLQMLLFKVSN